MGVPAGQWGRCVVPSSANDAATCRGHKDRYYLPNNVKWRFSRRELERNERSSIVSLHRLFTLDKQLTIFTYLRIDTYIDEQNYQVECTYLDI